MAKKNIHYWALVLTETEIQYHIAQTIDCDGDKRIHNLNGTFCKSYPLDKNAVGLINWLIDLKQEIHFYNTQVWGTKYSEQVEIEIGTRGWGGEIVTRNIW